MPLQVRTLASFFPCSLAPSLCDPKNEGRDRDGASQMLAERKSWRERLFLSLLPPLVGGHRRLRRRRRRRRPQNPLSRQHLVPADARCRPTLTAPKFLDVTSSSSSSHGGSVCASTSSMDDGSAIKGSGSPWLFCTKEGAVAVRVRVLQTGLPRSALLLLRHSSRSRWREKSDTAIRTRARLQIEDEKNLCA